MCQGESLSFFRFFLNLVKNDCFITLSAMHDMFQQHLGVPTFLVDFLGTYLGSLMKLKCFYWSKGNTLLCRNFRIENLLSRYGNLGKNFPYHCSRKGIASCLTMLGLTQASHVITNLAACSCL